MSQIPKRLFYVWFGEDVPNDVHACIQTWKLAMPDFEIIKIDENKSQWFDFHAALANSEWLKAVYERKLWAYVSDYIRIKVLYDHGGIYLDTDVTTVRGFGPLIYEQLFIGLQSDIEVNGAVIGSIKGHEYLKLLLTYYEDGFIFSGSRYLLPEIMTHILVDKYNFLPYDSRAGSKIVRFMNISIYPESAFYPFRYREKYTDECIKVDTYSVHWWKASWVSQDSLSWLQVGRLFYLSETEGSTGLNNTDVVKSGGRNHILKTVREFFYKVKRKEYIKKYYILCVPVLTIREPKLKKYLYLFNTIPLYVKK